MKTEIGLINEEGLLKVLVGNFRGNLKAVLKEMERTGLPVALMNRNEIIAYVIPGSSKGLGAQADLLAAHRKELLKSSVNPSEQIALEIMEKLLRGESLPADTLQYVQELSQAVEENAKKFFLEGLAKLVGEKKIEGSTEDRAMPEGNSSVVEGGQKKGRGKSVSRPVA